MSEQPPQGGNDGLDDEDLKEIFEWLHGPQYVPRAVPAYVYKPVETIQPDPRYL